MNIVIKQIENVLNAYIRPTLSKHQGNVEIISYQNHILELKLLGQCKHCPNAQTDTKHFMEEQFQKQLPAIRKIILNDDVDEALLDLTYRILNHTI